MEYTQPSYMTGLEIIGVAAVAGTILYGSIKAIDKLAGGSGGHTTAHTAPIANTIDSKF